MSLEEGEARLQVSLNSKYEIVCCGEVGRPGFGLSTFPWLVAAVGMWESRQRFPILIRNDGGVTDKILIFGCCSEDRMRKNTRMRMGKLSVWLGRIRPLILPEPTPSSMDEGRSVLTRLAIPHSFGPDLGPWSALLAVLGCLARIFGACLLFAVWGGFSALAWSAIGNRVWPVAAILPAVLVFLILLAALMIAVSAVENAIRARC
jgi:hypothetical protein